MHLDILGVRVDNFYRKEALERVKSFLKSGQFNQITTVNPEFTLRAQKDSKFREVLNNSELNVADGIGIKLAFWRFKKQLKERITGVDFMFDILRIADKEKLKIFLVANEGGISSWEETAEVIKKIYPNIKVNGINASTSICCFESKERNEVFEIKDYPILFCNFGAPEQELFISNMKKHNKYVRVAVGVGGGFDFISGKTVRAPRWMRKIGLEWLWRLILQPWRINRIFNAVIVFPIRIIFNK